MKNRIGIMQGRLSRPLNDQIQAFPINSWKKEFAKAEKCGFELIEWVFDGYLKNPILTDEGIKEIKSSLKNHNIAVNSLCADYFMNNLLFKVPNNELEKNLKVLSNLIKQCHKLDIEILELPFVDSSSIKNEEEKNQVIDNLNKVLLLAQDNNVIITLETDLPPVSFQNLISQFNHRNVKANYDIGNSTSKDYDIKLELETFGNSIINIHIKDRIINGPTVPLGTGDANFDLFFLTLSKIDYKGDFIIQGAREDMGEQVIEPEPTCKKYLEFVRRYVNES